jgi:hypothetical protein
MYILQKIAKMRHSEHNIKERRIDSNKIHHSRSNKLKRIAAKTKD